MITSRPSLLPLALIAAACIAPAPPRPSTAPDPPPSDWPSYGRTPQGDRFSPLAEITRENVRELAPAWSFSTRERATRATRRADRRRSRRRRSSSTARCT